jgi:hypothetical protein
MIMKTKKTILWLFFFFAAAGLSLTSCKKEASSSSGSITSQQTIQVQNSDAQDALADKTEEDIDNNLEELQNNNYVVATGKSFETGTPANSVVITVDHPDTTFFPKVVTITYNTYQDSSANEPIIKNGKITIQITKPIANHARLFSRAFTFTNFSVTTDSTTIIMNGTRTVTRIKDALKLNGIVSARISVTDNITASLSYAIAVTGKSDTLRFTRVVNKVRTAVSYFKNAGSLLNINFRHVDSSDTLTYNGTVTGINEKGDSYSKTITIPLIVTNYKGSLVVSSGDMTYAVGSTDSYQISFKADPSNKHLTLVTVTNNQTGKTRSFDRRFGRIFNKWW